MKKSNLNQFQQFSLTTEEMNDVKGGNIFCEWYVGYAKTTGQSIDPGVMSEAMQFDMMYMQYGYDEAMANGGAEFMSNYNW